MPAPCPDWMQHGVGALSHTQLPRNSRAALTVPACIFEIRLRLTCLLLTCRVTGASAQSCTDRVKNGLETDGKQPEALMSAPLPVGVQACKHPLLMYGDLLTQPEAAAAGDPQTVCCCRCRSGLRGWLPGLPDKPGVPGQQRLPEQAVHQRQVPGASRVLQQGPCAQKPQSAVPLSEH